MYISLYKYSTNIFIFFFKLNHVLICVCCNTHLSTEGICIYYSTLLVQHEYDQTRFFINIGALTLRMNRNVKPTFFFPFQKKKTTLVPTTSRRHRQCMGQPRPVVGTANGGRGHPPPPDTPTPRQRTCEWESPSSPFWRAPRTQRLSIKRYTILKICSVTYFDYLFTQCIEGFISKKNRFKKIAFESLNLFVVYCYITLKIKLKRIYFDQNMQLQLSNRCIYRLWKKTNCNNTLQIIQFEANAFIY